MVPQQTAERGVDVMDAQFQDEFAAAPPGKTFVYHRGFLAIDRWVMLFGLAFPLLFLFGLFFLAPLATTEDHDRLVELSRGIYFFEIMHGLKEIKKSSTSVKPELLEVETP